jgi:transposase
MKRRFSRGSKVYLATQGADMRKQVNGLAAIVQSSFGADLFDGSMFVFCNSSKKIIKILCWDIDGFVLYYKRRERGCFYWPKFDRCEDGTVSVGENDLNRLLDGLVMEQFVPKRSYKVI